jgi:hypothetical protein
VKKTVVLAFPAIYFAMTALAGCGGGSSAVAPAQGTILKGAASVPAGTPTRHVGRGSSPDVPLPGATARLFDISTSGLAALNGTPVQTTQTANDGSYSFSGLVLGHNYVVSITKSVTGSGNAKLNLSLGAYVHLAATATAPTTAPVNFSTTVASNYIVQTLTANPAEASVDLTSVFTSVVASVTTQIQQGTITTQDLSQSFTNPTSYSTVISQVAANSLMDASYIDNTPVGDNTRRDIVCLMTSKTLMKVKLVLIVKDATGNVFDADYYSGALNADGTFGGVSTDGLYNITGAVTGQNAHGNWAAVDGSANGVWQADAAAGHPANASTPTYVGVGYQGKFYKGTSATPEGVWFFFVRSDSNAIMMAHDEARAGLTHLEKTTVIVGKVDAMGHVSGNMVFPAVATDGSLSGLDAAEGGTATGTGSASLGTHTTNGTVSVTGAIANDAVTGTWAFTGTKDGAAYSNAGTWGGTTF